MSYLLNNQQKMNEIIFANRNKSYGAYAIRSSYGATLFKSLCCIFFGFGSIMYTAYYFSKGPEQPSQTLLPPFKMEDSVYTLRLDLKKDFEDPQPEKPKSEPGNQASSSALGTHVVDSASTVTTNTLNLDNPFNASGEGTVTTTTPTGGGGDPTGGGTATTQTAEIIHSIADTEPQFEGGLRALYAFLGSKLKYPEKAADYGKQGTVYVRFVVDQKGKVGNLSLLNSLGYGLDEEALRVVAMIPDFKSPGTVNGKAVKVYYQLPIKFSYQK